MQTEGNIDKETKKDTTECPMCKHEMRIDRTSFFKIIICENCFNYAKIEQYDMCCKEPDYHRVKFITASHTIQVREQCMNCGCLKGNSIGGIPQKEKDLLPLADLSMRDNLQEIISQAWQDAFERKQQGRNGLLSQVKQDWMQQYNAYLQSPIWQQKRLLVLKRDNHRCQACLTNTATQVHHKSYEFCDLKGSEPCFDLVSVCAECHRKIEAMKKANKQIQKQ